MYLLTTNDKNYTEMLKKHFLSSMTQLFLPLSVNKSYLLWVKNIRLDDRKILSQYYKTIFFFINLIIEC